MPGWPTSDVKPLAHPPELWVNDSAGIRPFPASFAALSVKALPIRRSVPLPPFPFSRPLWPEHRVHGDRRTGLRPFVSRKPKNIPQLTVSFPEGDCTTWSNWTVRAAAFERRTSTALCAILAAHSESPARHHLEVSAKRSLDGHAGQCPIT